MSGASRAVWEYYPLDTFVFFHIKRWPLSCVLFGWRMGPCRDYLLREDASTETHERGPGTGGVEVGAGNNMSNFINGRERLWLPKSPVKDRGTEWRGGEWRGRQGESDGGRQGGSVTQSVKEREERGAESRGWVVNGCNWVREEGATWEGERLERWKDEEGRFPTSCRSTSITLSLSLCLCSPPLSLYPISLSVASSHIRLAQAQRDGSNSSVKVI